jgi:signal-transduction protein with cAMP-binding, CBS, and nucleotidyltransferase domain
MKNENKIGTAAGTQPVITIQHDALLSEALAVMMRHRIHHLVVVRETRVLGVLSYRSLVEAQFNRGFAGLTELKAAEALANEILLVDEDFDLKQALQAVLDQGRSALLVQARSGVAIVTETDLLRVLDRLLHHRSHLESFKDHVEGILAEPIVRLVTKLLADAGI